MKRMTPKKRKSHGIACTIFGALLLIAWIILMLTKKAVSSATYMNGLLAIFWFTEGIYTLATLRTYKEKYFPDRSFATPVSADGSPLEDNSEKLNEEIKKEAHKYSIDDYNKARIHIFAILTGIILIYIIAPDFPDEMFIGFLIFGIIAFLLLRLKLSPKAEKYNKLIITFVGFGLMLGALIYIIVAYILRINVIVSAIIGLGAFIGGALILFLSMYKSYKKNMNREKYDTTDELTES
ncbi:MAG: hypothetical protein K8S87_08820 [Planctomycetes bacterium]|nr:hypothetical protein [Planctomycetota bacterium]